LKIWIKDDLLPAAVMISPKVALPPVIEELNSALTNPAASVERVSVA
jgi:hypothetical protein